MTRHLITESGAHYEATADGRTIRRLADNTDTKKRGDGAWLTLLRPLSDESYVGHRMILAMESLNRLGPDDHGVPQGDPRALGITTRTTTPVVSDEWIPA